MPAKMLYSGPVLKPRSRNRKEDKGLSNILNLKDLYKDHETWVERFLWLEEDRGEVSIVYSEEEGREELKRISMAHVEEIKEVRSRYAVRELALPRMDLANQVFMVRTRDKWISFASTDKSREVWLAEMRKHLPNDAMVDCHSDVSSSATEYSDSTYTSQGSFATDEDDEYDSQYEEDMEYDYNEEVEEEEMSLGSPMPTESHVFVTEPAVFDPATQRNSKSATVPRNFVKQNHHAEKLIAKILDADSLKLNFAAIVTKVSSKDRDLSRVLMLTSSMRKTSNASVLNLISHTTVWQARTKIPVSQIRGILRNQYDPLQLAVLWSRGHDYLLSFSDNEQVDVFIGHMARAHYEVTRTNTFIIRESQDILVDIRRSDYDTHEPLEQGVNDKYAAASDEDIFPSLRAKGDKKVCLSELISKVSESGPPLDKLLVLTDQAIYYYQPRGSRMDRRIYLKDVRQVLYDAATRYFLVQVHKGTKAAYGAKGGDLMFHAASPDFAKNFEAELKDIKKTYFPQVPDAPVVKRETKQHMDSVKQLEVRDTFERTVGHARKAGHIAREKVRRNYKKMRIRLRRVRGGVFKVGGAIVEGALSAPGALLAEDDVGLHPAMVAAARDCRVSLRSLTGPNGNAVYSPAAMQTIRNIKKDAISREPYGMGQLVAHVRKFYDGGDEGDNNVWFACACTDLMENPNFHNVHKVLVLTSTSLHIYSDPKMGAANPVLRMKKREIDVDVKDLMCFIGCSKTPEHFMIMAKGLDLVLSCKSSLVLSLRSYIYRRCSKSYERRALGVPKLRVGEVETTEALKILAQGRSPEDETQIPQSCLPADADPIHIASCERAIELLSAYQDAKIYYSCVADVHLIKTTDAQPEYVLKGNHFVLITSTAIYGLGQMRKDERLEVKFRIELPSVFQLLVEEADNQHVVLQTLRYEVTFKFADADGKRVKVLSDAGVVAALEAAFGISDAFDVVSYDDNHIHFRLWPVTKIAYAVLEKRMRKAVDILSNVFLDGEPIEVEKVSKKNSLLLVLPLASVDDFSLQLTRIWVKWTSYGAAGTRDVTPLGGSFSGNPTPPHMMLPERLPNQFEINVSYAPSQGKERDIQKGQHKLTGYSTYDEGAFDSDRPESVWAGYQRWFEKQVRIAMETDPTGERITWELKRGVALGQCARGDQRDLVVKAREQAAGQQDGARTLAKMKQYLRDLRFGRFEHISQHVNPAPSLQVYPGRGFRATLAWSRKEGAAKCVPHYADGRDLCTKAMTLDAAKEYCLRSSNCLGFTYFGDDHVEPTDEIDVTFKSSATYDYEPVFSDLRNTVCLGLFPNEGALVPLLNATTYLKVPDEVSFWMEFGEQLAHTYRALEQLQKDVMHWAEKNRRPRAEEVHALNEQMEALLQHGVNVVPSSRPGGVQFSPRNSLSPLGTVVNTLATLIPQRAFDEVIGFCTDTLKEALNTDQLVLTAILQRKNLRKAKRDARSALQVVPEAGEVVDFDALRLNCLAWGALMDEDEHDRDMQQNLVEIEDLATQLWNAQVDLWVQDRSINNTVRAAMEGDYQALVEEFEEVFPMVFGYAIDTDEATAWVERAVRHRWTQMVPLTARRDQEIMSWFAEERADTLRLVVADRRMKLAVRRHEPMSFKYLAGEQKLAETCPPDIRDHIPGWAVLERRIERYREDLENYTELEAIERNVENVLASARDVMANPRMHTEHELQSLVESLQATEPQIQRFATLEPYLVEVAFVVHRLQCFLRGMAEEKVREEASREERRRMEEFMRKRSEAMQSLLDAKEVQKQKKEEAMANRVYAKALKMKERFEKTKTMNLKPHDPIGTKRQRDCLAELTNARATAQTNNHKNLQAAIELLEEVHEKWDQLLIGKEEQERLQLKKEVEELVGSKDKYAYLDFLKTHENKVLPIEYLMKIKVAWNALVSEHNEKRDAVKAVEEALKTKDRYEIEQALNDAAKKEVDEDDPVIVRANEMLLVFKAKAAGGNLAASFDANGLGEGAGAATKANGAGGGDGDGGAAGDDDVKDDDSFVDSEGDTGDNKQQTAFARDLQEGLSPSPGRSEGSLTADHSPTASPTTQAVPFPASGAGGGGGGGGRSNSITLGSAPPEAAPPQEPEISPPANGNELTLKVYHAIMKLLSTCEINDKGLRRVSPSNPAAKDYYVAWMGVIRHKLKKSGKLLKKTERFELDVFQTIQKELLKSCPESEHFHPIPRAMNLFESKFRKLNKMKTDVHTFFIQYLMQSGRFNEAMNEVLSLKFQNPEILRILYGDGAVFQGTEDVKYLMTVMKATKKFRFEFKSTDGTKYMLDNEDVQYLKAIDAAELPPKITPKEVPLKPALPSPPREGDGDGDAGIAAGSPDARTPDGGGGGGARGGSAEETSGPGAAAQGGRQYSVVESEWDEAAEEDVHEALEEFDVQNFQQEILSQADQFTRISEIGKLKIAVHQVHKYIEGLKQKHKIKKGERLREFFNEGKYHALGILARERICPAITALMMSGFKAGGGFGRKKRHLWDFIQETAAVKKKFSRDLGSLKLPEGIDCVTSIIERRRSKAAPNDASGTRIQDCKVRSLICYALNHSHLKVYLEALYDLRQSPEVVNINKEWLQPSALLLQPDTRNEVDSVIEYLDALGFNLLLDADLW